MCCPEWAEKKSLPLGPLNGPSNLHLGLKTVGNSRKNTSTIFIFTFPLSDRNENGKVGTENDRNNIGNRKTAQSGRKHVENRQ